MKNKKALIKHISDIEEIVAGDKCYLKEIFHPDRDDVELSYSLAYAYINPHGKTADHFLLQSETYYIISGEGMMHLGEDVFPVHSGSSYIVPPETHQWIENIGEKKLEFMVMVDPPWQKEDEFVCE